MLQFLLTMVLVLGDGPSVYGKGVKAETPTISIEQLMANPANYLDKVVKVEGTVQEVCPMKGCWMDIVEGDSTVRVKVKDGEIVFDKELEGKTVIAEGTVYTFDMTKENAIEYYRHLAEEKGEEFDESSVTGPVKIYQLGGIGAKVR